MLLLIGVYGCWDYIPAYTIAFFCKFVSWVKGLIGFAEPTTVRTLLPPVEAPSLPEVPSNKVFLNPSTTVLGAKVTLLDVVLTVAVVTVLGVGLLLCTEAVVTLLGGGTGGSSGGNIPPTGGGASDVIQRGGASVLPRGDPSLHSSPSGARLAERTGSWLGRIIAPDPLVRVGIVQLRSVLSPEQIAHFHVDGDMWVPSHELAGVIADLASAHPTS